MSFLHRREAGSFSLMEVVIATGVFAFAIVAVIGLLGVPSRSAREVLDSDVAARLAEGVDEQLKNFVRAQGFDNLNQTIQVVASADGSEMRRISPISEEESGGSAGGTIEMERQYFLLVISPLLSPAPGEAYRAFQVQVEWPYRLPPEGAEAARTQRSSFSFNTAILR